MRWILYLFLLGAALLVPLEKNNVGQLQPMEVLYVSTEGEAVVLKTDTDDLGIGNTVEEAVRNLHVSTPGIVYLDTADYLIVNENAENRLEELEPYLKTSVRVCVINTEIDLLEAAEYLSVHKPKTKLKSRGAGERQKIIVDKNGRMKLKESY